VRARLVIFVVAAFVVIAYVRPSTAVPIIVGYSGVIDTVDDPDGFLSWIQSSSVTILVQMSGY